MGDSYIGSAVRVSDNAKTYVLQIYGLKINGFDVSGQIEVVEFHTPAPSRIVRAKLEARDLPKDPEEVIKAFPYHEFRLSHLDKPFSKDNKIGLVTHNHSRNTYYDSNNKTYPKVISALAKAMHEYIHKNWDAICQHRLETLRNEIDKMERHLLLLQSFSEDIEFGAFPLVEGETQPFRVKVKSWHDEGEDWSWTVTQNGEFVATDDGYSTSEEAIAAGEAHMAFLVNLHAPKEGQ